MGAPGQGPSATECLSPDARIARAGFSRAERLRRRDGFRACGRVRRRSGDGRFLVLAEPNDLSYARLGISVAKKKVRSAVARNRLKRLVRESFRTHKEGLAGLDVLVIASGAAATVANHQLSADLRRHWRKISLVS